MSELYFYWDEEYFKSIRRLVPKLAVVQNITGKQFSAIMMKTMRDDEVVLFAQNPEITLNLRKLNSCRIFAILTVLSASSKPRKRKVMR
jgi:hypothetical protein